MPLGKSAAVVIGSFPLGESDRVVTFYSRDFGKLRGVARAARRLRSRFGGALELFTLGQLVFFDTGRSDLVRVDHFDVVRPHARVRDDLDRLAQAAWVVECMARLTADRDPHVGLFALLVRALSALDGGRPPRRVAIAFGVRCIEALGHRLRMDGCVGCARRVVAGAAPVAVDVEAGGVVCAGCEPAMPAPLRVSPAAIAALRRERTLAWDAASAAPLGRVEGELRDMLNRQAALLMGQAPRTLRFVREMERFSGERR
jgi:DNA repair protein RecO (recombination protein O)